MGGRHPAPRKRGGGLCLEFAHDNRGYWVSIRLCNHLTYRSRKRSSSGSILYYTSSFLVLYVLRDNSHLPFDIHPDKVSIAVCRSRVVAFSNNALRGLVEALLEMTPHTCRRRALEMLGAHLQGFSQTVIIVRGTTTLDSGFLASSLSCHLAYDVVSFCCLLLTCREHSVSPPNTLTPCTKSSVLCLRLFVEASSGLCVSCVCL